jgi:hypothetical protein
MHKRFKLLPLLLLLLVLLSSCGENQNLTPPIVDDLGLLFGTQSTLDIVTWNLKTFPLDPNTISLLSDIIPAMEVDIIAFQEIMDYAQFQALAESMPHYNAFVYNATSSWRLAYLYDSRSVTINEEYTIYNGESNPFPRPPYILEINFANIDYVIINNHFKALGDNFIDETDIWDEEMRRRLASEMLETYISENHPDDRVVMLGDLNDQIQELVETNVFMAFLDKPDEYLFTTMPIALNPTPNTVSYPSYNSILDHILITDELFEDFAAAGSICRVIRVENHVGGLSAYYNLISDHRPVGVRLQAW